MKLRYSAIFAFLIIGMIAASCKKEGVNNTNVIQNPGEKISADGFNFATSKNVDISVRLLSNNNQPLRGVIVSFFKVGSTNSDQSVFKAVSDENGYIKGSVSVPSYIDTLVIDPNYIGLISNAKAIISGGNAINAIIGGSNVYEGDIVIDNTSVQTSSKSYNSIFATNYVFPNGSSNIDNNVYTVTGLPKYLTTADVIDASLLTALNSTLRTDISITSPDIVGTDATSVLNITKESEVTVTYVSSSASFFNTIGYYTYLTASGPPANAPDISKVTYIFPNTHYVESKYKGTTYKGIKAGDKVNLGTFPAGTTIAFVLFQNSWTYPNQNIGTINTNAAKFYSNSALNPETNTSIRRHNILLHDVSRDLYVLGFEDQLRSSTDNDFNDVVMYATPSVKGAISDTKVANLAKPDDTDGDGVLNNADEFPTDPAKAFISYFPSQTNWGTLAFEDNWPSTGDYDLNDLVVNYRYTYTSNASNNVVSIKGDFAVAAAGASYKNGFGVQFPFDATVVSEVTGQKLGGNYITTAANGLEAGQTKAVIIPFDNHEVLIKNANGGFINTEKGQSKVLGDTVHVIIKFTNPQLLASIGIAPFNPFLISNQRRGYEIHLPENSPTQKADMTLFGTLSDKSNPLVQSSFYKTAQNWPWAMSFIEQFYYPAETQSIDKAYPHFLDWAGSTAATRPYLDWYSNTAGGYRNTENIYIK